VATEGWNTLFDISDKIPDGWTVIGGQMVFLHCMEAGATWPCDETNDIDTVLNLRVDKNC